MRRHPLGPWPATAVVVVVEALFLLAAIPLALRVPEVKAVPALPESLELDYSTLRTAAVAPLEAGFIRDVLGIDLETGSTPGAGDDARSGSVAIGTPGAPGAGTPPTTFEHPLTNDDFADAITIPRLPFTAVTNTKGATTERGEPHECFAVGTERGTVASANNGTVWYRFTPLRDLGLTADTFGSDYAIALGVFSGKRLSDLRLLQCERDARGNSQTAFPARAGRTYYFQVTGLVTGGKLNFTLDAQGTTVLASRPDGGGESNGERVFGADFFPDSVPSLSGNGRYVAFDSAASNLVGEDDTNDSRDVFVRDLVGQRTERVSVSSAGEQGNGPSVSPSISADGRYVAFESQARNLVEDPPVCCWHVFVHDRVTGRTRLVPRSSSPAGSSWGPGVSISADGRHVAFESDGIYVHDLRTRETTRVASGNRPSISRTGRYVAFESSGDVFLRDRKRRITELISVHKGERWANGMPRGAGGSQPRVSGDGRYVTFESRSSELTADPPRRCEARHPWGATNQSPCSHIYVRDRVAGKTLHVSISSNGDHANHHSQNSGISGDGRFVTFDSYASNLVAGDGNNTACTQINPFSIGCIDVFVRDLITGTTTRVSVTSSGREGSDISIHPAISWDGSHFAFASAAPDLTRNDTNGAWDVFVHRRPVRPVPR